MAVIRACRDVLLSADAPVTMLERAVRCLAKTREAVIATGQPGGTVVSRDGGDVRWWNRPAIGPLLSSPARPGLTNEKQRWIPAAFAYAPAPSRESSTEQR
ncbi:hypothetical protein AB0C84_11940 [Actinomadura sp. NPDC048955]|uniref:hypothetical protein n=1 Tax=Actinomadura sp. NPDC048955 TaxID=3158228 RepID=UPI003403B938